MKKIDLDARKTMRKIGFIGACSTGKTTCASNMLVQMRSDRINAQLLVESARFVTFSPELFDTHPATRLHVLMRQIAGECERYPRDDTDLLICERTSLDWIIYYEWTCANVEVDPINEIVELGWRWLDTYDVLIYLGPYVNYIEDGWRPTDPDFTKQISDRYEQACTRLRQRSNGAVLHVLHQDTIDDRVVAANEIARNAVAAWYT